MQTIFLFRLTDASNLVCRHQSLHIWTHLQTLLEISGQHHFRITQSHFVNAPSCKSYYLRYHWINSNRKHHQILESWKLWPQAFSSCWEACSSTIWNMLQYILTGIHLYLQPLLRKPSTIVSFTKTSSALFHSNNIEVSKRYYRISKIRFNRSCPNSDRTLYQRIQMPLFPSNRVKETNQP